MEEGFQLRGTSAIPLDDADTQWEGISQILLGNQQWFQTWLVGEQRCQFLSFSRWSIDLHT